MTQRGRFESFVVKAVILLKSNRKEMGITYEY